MPPFSVAWRIIYHSKEKESKGKEKPIEIEKIGL